MKLSITYEETAIILNSFLLQENKENEKTSIKVLPDKRGVALKVLSSKVLNIPLGQTFRLELLDYSEGNCLIKIHAENLLVKLLIRILINLIYKRLKKNSNTDENPLTNYFSVKGSRIQVYLLKILEDFEIPFKITTLTVSDDMLEVEGKALFPENNL
jgi:hypothetical protein